MPNHKIASKDEWLAARKELLVKEKEVSLPAGPSKRYSLSTFSQGSYHVSFTPEDVGGEKVYYNHSVIPRHRGARYQCFLQR